MKELIKKLLPPIFIQVFRSAFLKKYGFSGSYKTWAQAAASCEGYAAGALFEKVKDAAIQVKSGLYFCERDSVLFGSPQYSWASLACLMSVAAREKGRLSVLDFGGSLGSSFFLNRRFLAGIDNEWSVVEQPHFVEEGVASIAGQGLDFYSDVTSCLSERKPNVLFLSSVLQYLEDPWRHLDDLLAQRFQYIIIDRTTFNNLGPDILKIQKVDPRIYEASYPVWIFDENNFKKIFFTNGYEIIESFDSTIDDFGQDVSVKGLFLKLKG